MESLCKRSKSKANFGVVDGSATRANTVIVSEPDMSNAISGVQVLSSITAPPGCVTERFYADTGANRSLHPNGRSAISYYRQKLDISTATTGKGMQSEGVGKMLIYAPIGSVFPGFDSVVFAKETSKKLASVGCGDGVCLRSIRSAYLLQGGLQG